jgi:hypothetical protein
MNMAIIEGVAMSWKQSMYVLFSGSLLGLASGCGNDCSSACSKIYDECKMSFEGLPTKSDCETQCKEEEKNNSDNTKKTIDCIMKTKCDSTELGACLTQ